MKSLSTVLLLVVFILSSCKKESLQGYLIESQEKENFMRLDLSTSLLSSYLDENASKDDRETFKSIQKVNIAFLPESKATEEEIEQERALLKNVMKNSDYKSLMRLNDKRGKATIYYSGQADAINEIIAIGYAKGFGVGVARVLGKNMNPAKIMKMLEESKLDENADGLVKLKDMFGGEFQGDKFSVDALK